MTDTTPKLSKPLASKPIKTRFLILSDTHSRDCPPDSARQQVDVVLHCGDLTIDSKLEEFKAAIRLLKALNAPLKLVIPGNHDLSLDEQAYKKKALKAQLTKHQHTHTHTLKSYGHYGKAKELFEKERQNGIILLDEGNHTFHLNNGAQLKIYASPYTRNCGEWGFQYSKKHGHEFSIQQADIVMTHGPPEGILDYSLDGKRLGCDRLFEAVAKIRPKMHCFGHIHESWGAKLVTWKGKISEKPSYLTDIDHAKNVRIKGLHSENLSSECEFTSHCSGDKHPLQAGSQTLFVNAAVDGRGNMPDQSPWIVDIELARVPEG